MEKISYIPQNSVGKNAKGQTRRRSLFCVSAKNIDFVIRFLGLYNTCVRAFRKIHSNFSHYPTPFKCVCLFCVHFEGRHCRNIVLKISISRAR